MTDLVALKAANARRWANAKQTRVFTSLAKTLLAAKRRYQAVEARTGVPWEVVAVIHERESGQNWSCSLAQGDPWNRVSVHVPAGRGPFKSWEDAAVDALMNCAPFLGRNRDWSIAGTLTRLEQYNGLKYAAANRPSPYVWSGTSIYDPPTGPGGKVLVDHGPIVNEVDKQPGCACLLLSLMALDPTIKFSDPTAAAALQAPTAAPRISPAPPSIRNPAKGSIGAFIASAWSALFRKT